MFDERMEALASSQRGLLSYEQVTALGLSESAIQHRRRTGEWRNVFRGVYRLAGAVDSPHLRAMAAVLGAGPEAILSHTSAAGLLGFPGFTIDPVTVSIPRSRRTLAGVRVEQSLELPLHHRRIVDGIPCTSIARTLFDLCGDVRPGRAERALDGALARKRVTFPALWRVLDDLAVQGRAGTVLLRELLTKRGPRYVPPESELETRLLELVAGHHLPEPARQADLGDADSWIGRVDFVWRQARLVVEVDGAAFHDGFLNQQSDRERDERLTVAGWTVLRFRWDAIVNQPATVADRIRAGLDSDCFRGVLPSL
jgi:very-short-patch-repair endonuclease